MCCRLPYLVQAFAELAWMPVRVRWRRCCCGQKCARPRISLYVGLGLLAFWNGISWQWSETLRTQWAASSSDVFAVPVHFRAVSPPGAEAPRPRAVGGPQEERPRETSGEVPGALTDGDCTHVAPQDLSSQDAMERGGWQFQAPGALFGDRFEAGPTGGESRLSMPFQRHGVTRMLVRNSGVAGGDPAVRGRGSGSGLVVVEFAGTLILELRQGEECRLEVRHEPGDELAISEEGGRAWLQDLSWCAAAPAAPAGSSGPAGACVPGERVRLGWAGCAEWGPAGRAEGRVDRVLNDTHAAVWLTGGFTPPAPAQAVAFVPSSPLVSYSDQGTCGARGDDAKADPTYCSAGMELLVEKPMDSYKVQATVNGCNYFSYKVSDVRSSTGGGGPHKCCLMGSLFLCLSNLKGRTRPLSLAEALDTSGAASESCWLATPGSRRSTRLKYRVWIATRSATATSLSS
ncbi:unnamed protein product [Prorocentrum cordatum]|uniref:Altered inheritance of mitochondria protein 24, mitochondrial n=1 Tax=Prorocentrum cordatum TaxID=2364126 RepID=A0ABN9VGR9_9DINO|nr:unnamed protein product [Polarella glacialis]